MLSKLCIIQLHSITSLLIISQCMLRLCLWNGHIGVLSPVCHCSVCRDLQYSYISRYIVPKVRWPKWSPPLFSLSFITLTYSSCYRCSFQIWICAIRRGCLKKVPWQRLSWLSLANTVLVRISSYQYHSIGVRLPCECIWPLYHHWSSLLFC